MKFLKRITGTPAADDKALVPAKQLANLIELLNDATPFLRALPEAARETPPAELAITVDKVAPGFRVALRGAIDAAPEMRAWINAWLDAPAAPKEKRRDDDQSLSVGCGAVR